jgi:hypothetical protein
MPYSLQGAPSSATAAFVEILLQRLFFVNRLDGLDLAKSPTL